MQEISGAYTSPILDTDELKMALRARKVSGIFEKRRLREIGVDFELTFITVFIYF